MTKGNSVNTVTPESPIFKFDILTKEGTMKRKPWLITAGPETSQGLGESSSAEISVGCQVVGKPSNRRSPQCIVSF